MANSNNIKDKTLRVIGELIGGVKSYNSEISEIEMDEHGVHIKNNGADRYFKITLTECSEKELRTKPQLLKAETNPDIISQRKQRQITLVEKCQKVGIPGMTHDEQLAMMACPSCGMIGQFHVRGCAA